MVKASARARGLPATTETTVWRPGVVWEPSGARIQSGIDVDSFDHMGADQWIQRIIFHLLEVRRDKYPR
jgi:hypothetical protein